MRLGSPHQKKHEAQFSTNLILNDKIEKKINFKNDWKQKKKGVVIKIMKIKLDIKIKWNKMLRDEIKNKNQLKNK